jgi:hypothetical protein
LNGTTESSVSYELLRRITTESYEFCVGFEVIQDLRETTAGIEMKLEDNNDSKTTRDNQVTPGTSLPTTRDDTTRTVTTPNIFLRIIDSFGLDSSHNKAGSAEIIPQTS